MDFLGAQADRRSLAIKHQCVAPRSHTTHGPAPPLPAPQISVYVKARPKRKTLRHMCTYATVNANKRSGDAHDTGLTATGAAAGC